MSGPRTKRQFAGAACDPAQRQITSFFSRGGASSTEHARPAPPLNGPVLPGQVQTNLLNVGMRVRKAVPEGYKTGTTYSAFKLWSEDDVRSSSSAPVPAPVRTATNPVSAIPNTLSSSGGGVVRELVPFCGLLKVGGLGSQEEPVGGATDGDFSGFDAFPFINSQESMLSNTSTTSALEATGRAMNSNGKRLFVDATEGGDEDGADFTEAWLEDTSSRVLAVPRRRQQGGKNRLGQESVGVAGGPNGNDFEEAEFLQYSGMDVEA